MKRYLVFLVFFLLSLVAHAQTFNLSGTITDNNGEPIPFATILVKNTSKGSSANTDGQYILSLSTGTYEVLFKAIGFKQETRTINLKGNQVVNVSLAPEAYQLQNVVVKAGGL
jgi:uncharacterized membrane protein